MSEQVDALRAQVRYAASRRLAIEEIFSAVASRTCSVLKDPVAARAATERLHNDETASRLYESYEAVELLVGSELDLVSRGGRGLGRSTADLPRFAEVFRERLSESAVTKLGPRMEDLCTAGFAAGLVVDVIGRPMPTMLRTRQTDALIEQWARRCIGVWSDWPDEVLAVVAACTSEQRDAFRRVAAECGLPRRWRGRRDRKRIEGTAFLLVAAGANLLAAHAASSDHWFA